MRGFTKTVIAATVVALTVVAVVSMRTPSGIGRGAIERSEGVSSTASTPGDPPDLWGREAPTTSLTATPPVMPGALPVRIAVDGRASIRVEVTRLSDGAPVAGASVALRARNPDGTTALVDRALTDVEGRVGFSAAPGILFDVVVEEEAWDNARSLLAELDAGQERSVLFVLDDEGRAIEGTVTDADDVPLSGVRLDRADGSLLSMSDEFGRFAVRVPPSELEDVVVVFSKPGFAPEATTTTDLLAGSGHSIALFHAATLVATVAGTSGAGAPARTLRLERRVPEDGHGVAACTAWERDLDAAGSCVFAELPPEALRAILIRGDGSRIDLRPMPSLEEGEHAAVTWNLDELVRVHGRYLDADGRPLAGRWIALGGEEEFDQVPDDRPLLLPTRADDARVASTDERGAFSIDGVEPGTFWVGALNDFAQAVTVRGGTGDQEVNLVQSGLFIDGEVLGVDGLPTVVNLDLYDVLATPKRRASLNAYGGRFHLGPLPAGRYELRATLHGLAFLDAPWEESSAVTVDAGARDVILRLRAGLFVRGCVVAEEGVTQTVGLQYFLDGHCVRSASAQVHQEFREALPPRGTELIVSAHTRDGPRFGWTSARVGEGNAEPNVEVALGPAAWILVHGVASLRVAADGVFVAETWDRDDALVVPTGRLHLIGTTRSGAAIDRLVAPAAGDVLDLGYGAE